MGKQHTKFTDICGKLVDLWPLSIEVSIWIFTHILFVSVDRPSPNLNTKFQLNCVWKGWGYFRGDDFLCSGKKKLTILCFEQINLQPPPKQKVSNYTWELQPRCSTSGCNNVCSFQINATKEVRMTTQGRDSHSQGGAANSWRSWVPVISKEEKHGRKERQMLFMFHTCF